MTGFSRRLQKTTYDTAPIAPSGYPNASNTGVPVGTVLTNYTGPSVITTAGTVIDSKTITYGLDIRANNVTIRNCSIQVNDAFFVILSDNGNTNFLIEDCEIDGGNNTSGDSAIGGYNYTIRRCNIHSLVDGLKVGSNTVVQDCYIHDLAMFQDSHNDGIQCLGTTSLQILHNTIIVEDGATSAIILSTGSADDMRNILINDNLMGGGAFTVYGGYQAGVDQLSKVSNIQITNNKFTTQIFPNSGAFGPLTSRSSPVVVTGNVWYDGPNAGQTVS